MNGLVAVLIILLALILIGQIRIGAQVEYCADGLFVRVRVGTFLIPVFPVKKNEGEKRKKKAKQPKEPRKKKGGMLKLALDFVPVVLDTLKRFGKSLRVDKLDMELTFAATDPADAAVRYGQANALLGSLWQPITQTLHVVDGHAHVGVDFEETQSTLYILASLSLNIARTVTLVVVFGWKALAIFIRNRSRRVPRPEQGEAV